MWYAGNCGLVVIEGIESGTRSWIPEGKPLSMLIIEDFR